LGSCGDSSGAVCVAKSWSSVSVAREEQSGGVWEDADEWSVYLGPHNHLLWSYYHISYCYWCSYQHWLG